MTTEHDTSVTGGLSNLLAQATPGPWAFDCQPSGTRYDGVEYVVPMVDGPTTRLMTGTSTVVVHEYEPVLPETECVHNARLIALAPDAVSLLIDMAAALASPITGCPNCGEPDCGVCELLARFAELDRRAVR